MKLVALTSAALLAATTAFAGNVNFEAPVEVPVVEETPTTGGSGSGAWLIPAVAIVAIAAAVIASQNDDKK